MKFQAASSILLTLLTLQRSTGGECNRSSDSKCQENQQHFQHTRALDETKEVINKTTDGDASSQEPSRADQYGPVDIQVSRDMYRPEQMRQILDYFYNIAKFDGQLPVTRNGYILLTTRSHSVIYDDMLMHRYDNYAEIKQATGAQLNQDLCLSQLEQLVARADAMIEQRENSTDWELFRLLDHYGRPAAGVAEGNLLWLGMYEACQSFQLKTREGLSAGRYCLASLKNKHWPKEDELSKVMAFKAGVCLPKACDSLPYKSKFDLIQKLIDFNLRRLDKNQLKLDGLYCVPDEDSPMRMWWRSPRTLLAALLLSGWLALLIYATISHDSYLRRAAKGSSGIGSGDVGQTGKKCDAPLEQISANQRLRIYRMLSITNNFGALMNTSSSKSVEPDSGGGGGRQDAQRTGEGSAAAAAATGGKLAATGAQAPVVDLKCLEGIKVICMWFIIMGHVLMAIPNIMSNGRDLATTSSPMFILSNLMPAFAVNAFFSITGLLTCYLMLKQNESHAFLANPLKWLIILVYRYLRIMPVYAVATYFCKNITKHLGSGPLWDYATSSLAHRRRCEQESWLWTFLLGANFKSPFDHCIPSAWYLANDFQFLLLTPLFLLALHKRAPLGRALLYLGMLAGILAGFASMSSAQGDIRPVANFMPHGFKTYITYLKESYTQPQCRIPAYLCGLLLGHFLYSHETAKLRHRAALNEELAAHEKKKKREALPEVGGAPEWPSFFINYGARLSLLALLLYAAIPLGPGQLKLTIPLTKLLLAVTMSTYHVVFALGVGLYILLAATNHGHRAINHFLSAPIWKPLARLNLCIVLVNIEVINYIIQSHRQHVHVDFLSQTAIYLLCLVATYLVAIVAHVLVEAPMKSSLNHLVASVVNKLNVKQKSQ